MTDQEESPQDPGRSPGGKRPGGGEDARITLIETVFPKRADAVFRTAIALGGILILVGLTTLLLANRQIEGNFILCFGLALIVAAFGSQATIRVGRLVVAGAAAIGVALFWVISAKIESTADQEIERLKHSYQRGIISNADPAKVVSISMGWGVDFLGNLDASGQVYHFALFGQLPERDQYSLHIDDGSDAAPILAIHRSCIRKHRQSGKTVEWRLDLKTMMEGEQPVTALTLFDISENTTIAVYGDPTGTRKCTAFATLEGEGSPARLADLSILGRALAAFKTREPVPSRKELRDALARLANPNTQIRRGARSMLASAPVDFVPEILAAMKAAPGNYRIVLGGSVALTLMLRRDKGLSKDLRNVLVVDDLNLLLKAAADRDRTMRIYATEFLYDLGDPRTTEIALRLASATSDEMARYNLIFIAKGGWRDVAASKKRLLQADLKTLRTTSGARTVELLKFFDR